MRSTGKMRPRSQPPATTLLLLSKTSASNVPSLRTKETPLRRILGTSMWSQLREDPQGEGEHSRRCVSEMHALLLASRAARTGVHSDQTRPLEHVFCLQRAPATPTALSQEELQELGALAHEFESPVTASLMLSAKTTFIPTRSHPG